MQGEHSVDQVLEHLKELGLNESCEAFVESHFQGFKLLDELGIGVFIWRYAQRQLAYCGSVFLTLLGFESTERPDFSEVWSRIHPEDRLRLPELMERALPHLAHWLGQGRLPIQVRFHYRVMTESAGQQWVMSQHKVLLFQGRLMDLGTVSPLAPTQLDPPQGLNLECEGEAILIEKEREPLPMELFSPRQLQILKLSLDGLPVDAIAAQMGLSASGVRFHRRNILRIASARSMAELRRRWG